MAQYAARSAAVVSRSHTVLVESRAASRPGFASATPETTWWLRPEMRASIAAAWAASRGLPSTSPSSTTSVSAPSTGVESPGASPARPARAFARARRCTSAAGSSPGSGVSSTSAGTTRKRIPIWPSSSCRRGEREAR